jgi:outer membrane lipoprotein SlyB
MAIAKAVAVEAYGQTQVESQFPLKIRDDGQHWTVVGSLPEGVPGGVVQVLIAKTDGRILSLEHGK